MCQFFRCELFPDLQAEKDVFVDAPPFQKMILLEHISYSGTAGGYQTVSQSNGTVLRSEQAGNEIQKSGFSASGRSYNGQEFTGHQVKGYMRKGGCLTGQCVIGETHVPHFQDRIHGCCLLFVDNDIILSYV